MSEREQILAEEVVSLNEQAAALAGKIERLETTLRLRAETIDRLMRDRAGMIAWTEKKGGVLPAGDRWESKVRADLAHGGGE